jgi:DNA-directed RNA polymerase subunit RPC12/RpoP
MQRVYKCEKCGQEFNNEQECINHEQNCNPMITYVCDKCGKTESYGINELIPAMWHSFDFGEPSYNSKLDGKLVKFELCDQCLFEFVNSFKYKDNILNSNEEKWNERYKIDVEAIL